MLLIKSDTQQHSLLLLQDKVDQCCHLWHYAATLWPRNEQLVKIDEGFF